MSPARRNVLLGVFGLACALLLVVGARRIVERQERVRQVERLREELYRARVDAQRCQRGLADQERALHEFDTRLGELRTRVDSFETLDARGVPAQEYDRYLESFDGYNDSVGVRRARADALRAAEASCRGVIQTHNALADSLRTVLGEDSRAGG